MYVDKFFEIQKKLNSTTKLDPNLNQYKVIARKNLHLSVLISDLANETECFKYWVGDCACHNEKVIFDKYITCLRQILTLGIDSNYDDITELRVDPNDYCLSDQFLNLYIDINDLIISPSKDHYITLFEDFLSLGISLGYSDELISSSILNY